MDTPRGKQLKNLLRATGPESGFNGVVFRTKHGYSKFHYRPCPADYNIEIKSEPSKVSGTFFSLINTVDHIPTTATSATGLVANAGICRLKSGYTMTNGSLSGTYSQVSIQGTLNGSNIMAVASYSLIEACSGTLTSVSHMAVSWLDSHLAAAPSSGTLSFQYITNNAAATFDNVWFIYPGNKITNLFTISDTDDGIVSDNTNSDYTFTNTRKIKIVLNSDETYYLIADKS